MGKCAASCRDWWDNLARMPKGTENAVGLPAPSFAKLRLWGAPVSAGGYSEAGRGDATTRYCRAGRVACAECGGGCGPHSDHQNGVARLLVAPARTSCARRARCPCRLHRAAQHHLDGIRQQIRCTRQFWIGTALSGSRTPHRGSTCRVPWHSTRPTRAASSSVGSPGRFAESEGSDGRNNHPSRAYTLRSDHRLRRRSQQIKPHLSWHQIAHLPTSHRGMTFGSLPSVPQAGTECSTETDHICAGRKRSAISGVLPQLQQTLSRQPG